MRQDHRNFRNTGNRAHARPGSRRSASGWKSLTGQIAALAIFGAVAGWNAVPRVMAIVDNMSRSPEEVAATERSVYYRNCDAARAAGVAPIYAGSPGYRDTLDGDSDGIACEPYRGM